MTVRLLDFANDKVPPFLRGLHDGLPALLGEPGALNAQLRAILQLGAAVDLQIMVPMVTAPAELLTVRAAVAAAAADLATADLATADLATADLATTMPPVGAMVETVPAGVRIAELAAVADFLSIGTNDLTATILGLVRTDARAGPALTAHPRVLAVIARVVRAADRAGCPVSVCGDAAADPGTLPLLVGAGVRAVSVACARVDASRALLRRLDTGLCRAVFAAALGCADEDEVLALVGDRIGGP